MKDVCEILDAIKQDTEKIKTQQEAYGDSVIKKYITGGGYTDPNTGEKIYLSPQSLPGQDTYNGLTNPIDKAVEKGVLAAFRLIGIGGKTLPKERD